MFWPCLPLDRALVDYTIFVDTPLELCPLGVLIETLQRGCCEASVRDFWESRAEPMFAQFVAPYFEADLVIEVVKRSMKSFRIGMVAGTNPDHQSLQRVGS